MNKHDYAFYGGMHFSTPQIKEFYQHGYDAGLAAGKADALRELPTRHPEAMSGLGITVIQSGGVNAAPGAEAEKP